jgi:hypothetical protein
MNNPVQFLAELREKPPKDSRRFQCLTQEWLGNAKGLYALLVLSFTLKASLFFMTDTISNDGPRYINQAIKFLEGNWREAIEIDGTFLYSLLIAAFGRMGFDLVQAGQVVSLIASVLVLIPLYLLFRGIFNDRVAFLGCLAFAISPGMNKFSVSVMRDPLFLLLFAWLVYFAWRAMEEVKFRYVVAITILILLSPLLRLEGLLIVPIILLVLLTKIIHVKRARKPLLIGTGSLVVLLSLVAIVGHSFFEFNATRQQRVRQIVSSINMLKENGLFNYHPVLLDKLEEMELSIPGGSARNDFAEISQNNIRTIYLFGVISLLAQDIWFPFFVAMLFGLRQLLVMGRLSIFLLLFILPFLVLAYSFNLNFGFLDERYLYAPAMLMFAGVGIGLERLFQISCRVPFPKVALGFLVIFFFGAPVVQAVREEAKPEAISSRLAGEWLAGHPELEESSLIANGEKIPFYAGRGRNFVAAEFSSLSYLRETAINDQIQLVAIEVRKSNLGNVPDFPGYSMLVKFEDPRYIALIYRRNP